MSGDERPYERQAAEALGRVLCRKLRRYECEPGGDDSLDYIDDLNEVYEMKSVTPEEYMELRAQRTQWYPSRVLALHWSILLEAPTKEGVDGSSPSEGLEVPANAHVLLSI